MSAIVTFVEEAPSFSFSMQDPNYVQPVLPMPLVEPFVYPTPTTVPISPNN